MSQALNDTAFEALMDAESRAYREAMPFTAAVAYEAIAPLLADPQPEQAKPDGEQKPASSLVEALESAQGLDCTGPCHFSDGIAYAISIVRQHTIESDVEAGGRVQFLLDVAAEVARARAKFPEGRHFIPALSEEHGELSNALLEQEYGKPVTSMMIYKEAVQVATMAMRIAEEGVLEFPKFVPPEKSNA